MESSDRFEENQTKKPVLLMSFLKYAKLAALLISLMKQWHEINTAGIVGKGVHVRVGTQGFHGCPHRKTVGISLYP